MEQNKIKELMVLLDRQQALGKQIEARLTAELHDGTSLLPVLALKDLARVERFGEVAHRHLLVTEAKGSMTLGESLAIRRQLFGDKVQTTANLFGVKGSGALFYRQTPYGKTRQDSDPVALTEEGKRIGGLWRTSHPAVTG